MPTDGSSGDIRHRHRLMINTGPANLPSTLSLASVDLPATLLLMVSKSDPCSLEPILAGKPVAVMRSCTPIYIKLVLQMK